MSKYSSLFNRTHIGIDDEESLYSGWPLVIILVLGFLIIACCCIQCGMSTYENCSDFFTTSVTIDGVPTAVGGAAAKPDGNEFSDAESVKNYMRSQEFTT